MTDTEGTIEREIRIEASPEAVFAYFTDPAKMRRWMGLDAKLDPVPGGVFRVDINGRDVARGEFVEVTAPARVVFTWGWEADGHAIPPGSTTVEATLTADRNGTLVRVVHRGLPGEEAVAGHAEGWDHFLPRLVDAGSGRDPGPDSWAD